MTIYRAVELKEMLLKALNETGELEVDLSDVGELDTAGLQVLIVAKKQAAAQNKSLHLIGHSPAVLEVIELFNLAAYFGDSLVIASSV